MKLIPQALLLLLTCAVGATAQEQTPQFKDYAVSERFSGKSASPILTGEARQFKTRLREAARGGPNFAGHYIVTYWGCGSGCVVGAIINARSGRVFMMPTTLCCWGFDVDDNFRPIEYRQNSKLIILSGARNEKEGDNATRFYKFENERLVLVKSVPR
jgi:hypothetical protein